MSGHNKTPTLPEILGDYARLNTARFHMPGHKGRDGIGILGEAVAKWDVTEIPGTDNLHDPQGAIKKSETAYSRRFGARRSFLLVNGSTAGVEAMLLALGTKKRVLLARDCHKAAISGIALADHEAKYVYPQFDAHKRINGVISADDIEAQLTAEKYDAVLITSPNYYGACADVDAIARVCHAHGARLLVDAAHAAHFPFLTSLHNYLPTMADMYCVSAHKTLSAFTQAAVLHVNSCCDIDDSHIQRILTLLQTSSPSYLLMASLDWALHKATQRTWNSHEARIFNLRKRLEALNGISMLNESYIGQCGIAGIDNTRITLQFHKRGITGYQAAQSLIKQGVVPEMADLYSVVLITGPADPDAWYERLYNALEKLPYGTKHAKHIPFAMPHGAPVLSVREATFARTEALALEDAIGRVAAVAAGPYPPGIATFFPGEIIEKEDIDVLNQYAQNGLDLFGVNDGKLSCVCR